MIKIHGKSDWDEMGVSSITIKTKTIKNPKLILSKKGKQTNQNLAHSPSCKIEILNPAREIEEQKVRST